MSKKTGLYVLLINRHLSGYLETIRKRYVADHVPVLAGDLWQDMLNQAEVYTNIPTQAFTQPCDYLHAASLLPASIAQMQFHRVEAYRIEMLQARIRNGDQRLGRRFREY